MGVANFAALFLCHFDFLMLLGVTGCLLCRRFARIPSAGDSVSRACYFARLVFPSVSRNYSIDLYYSSFPPCHSQSSLSAETTLCNLLFSEHA